MTDVALLACLVWAALRHLRQATATCGSVVLRSGSVVTSYCSSRRCMMRRNDHFTRGAILTSFLLLSAGLLAADSSARETMSLQTFGRATTGFIENRGQLDDAVLYYAPGSHVTVYFTAEAIVFDLKEKIRREDADLAYERRDRFVDPAGSDSAARRGCAVWLRFEGANPAATLEASAELATRYNYFLGDDPGAWRTNVPAYSEVVYRGLWPGIDLVYRADGGKLSYEVLATPGADPSKVRFRYDGAENVTSTADGSCSILTSVGPFAHIAPVRGSAVGQFRWGKGAIASGNAMPGSEAARRDGSALLWSTFLGGGDYDTGADVTLDPFGNPIVTGGTSSLEFPTTPGAYDESHNGGGEDVFVAKLDASGSTLLWSTFLGGGSRDMGRGLALDPSGNPVAIGWTLSSDFPVTSGAYDQSHNGNYDVFVAKLDDTGSVLLWSTFLGGSNGDDPYAGLTFDPSGNPVLTGNTRSSNFPTTLGAYDESHNGACDAFVAKLDASGSDLLWSTFVGGSEWDYGWSIALDPSGNPIVTGNTNSSNFPATSGAYDDSYNGEADAFVLKLDASGSSLLWSTFLGGTAGTWWYEGGHDLALDSSGNPVVAGVAASSAFPTTPGAYDETFNGGLHDLFIAKLSASGTTLLWSTFLGGSDLENTRGFELNPSGNAVVTGWTYSSDFPITPGAYDESFNGVGDVFVSELGASGGALLWSTFLGGSESESAVAIELDSFGNPIVTGGVYSGDFPVTPGAYDQSFGGNGDAFIAKLALAPALAATVDFDPNTLNCRSHGLYATSYIELPDGYDPAGIDVATVLLNDALPALSSPAVVGDHDLDGIPDRMVKFDRGEVIDLLPLGDEVEVVVSGELIDGTAFAGVDGIRVICKGRPIDVTAIRDPNLRVSSTPGVSSTTVSYELGAAGPVSLRVYDVNGRLVRTLVSGDQPAGQHEIAWDGRSDEGRRVGAGVYFIRLERAGEVHVAKTVVLK